MEETLNRFATVLSPFRTNVAINKPFVRPRRK